MGDERLTELRAAIAQRDGARIVAMSDQVEALQLVGHGLLIALALDVPGAGERAQRTAAALRERDWSGDDLLADELEGTPTDAEAIPADLELLAMVLEGDAAQGGGWFDRTTGEAWPEATFDLLEDGDDRENDERWLYVESCGSHDGYDDMVTFMETVDEQQLAARLNRAIQGRGAFRRFKDTLPDVERARFFAFSDDRQRGRARRWLYDRGYRPTVYG